MYGYLTMILPTFGCTLYGDRNIGQVKVPILILKTWPLLLFLISIFHHIESFENWKNQTQCELHISNLVILWARSSTSLYNQHFINLLNLVKNSRLNLKWLNSTNIFRSVNIVTFKIAAPNSLVLNGRTVC